VMVCTGGLSPICEDTWPGARQRGPVRSSPRASLALVAAEIVRHDNVAISQFWHEDVIDISLERVSVDQPIEHMAACDSCEKFYDCGRGGRTSSASSFVDCVPYAFGDKSGAPAGDFSAKYCCPTISRLEALVTTLRAVSSIEVPRLHGADSWRKETEQSDRCAREPQGHKQPSHTDHLPQWYCYRKADRRDGGHNGHHQGNDQDHSELGGIVSFVT
jgi:hypothetical protein